MFWDAILQRCRPDGAASHVIFFWTIFDEAQSQNCENGKTYARPARRTSGDSGEIEWHIYVYEKNEG